MGRVGGITVPPPGIILIFSYSKTLPVFLTMIAVEYMKYSQKWGEDQVSSLHYPGRVGEIHG